MVPDILKEVIYERSHLRAYSELLMFNSQGFTLVQLSQTETRAMQSLSETGNKQMLLWNISRNILANTALYNSRRRFGVCSAGCSCNWKPSTYSRDWARLFGDYEGWLQHWARALRVWTLVTDLACAETIHHLFDPRCLPRPLLWPSHSLSANRSVWHCFVCCICARMQLSVWLADGQLWISCLKLISAVDQKLIPGFLQFNPTVAFHCPLCAVSNCDRGHGGNVIPVCWR